MKRFIAIMLCLFALSFVIMGCVKDNGDNGDDTSASTTTSSEATTTEATTTEATTTSATTEATTKPAVSGDFSSVDSHVGDKMNYGDFT